MASYSIADMRTVGAFYASKLKAVGVRSTGKLLERASTPRGRKQLAELSGIPDAQILGWAKLADLMRIKGVAEDYADLLSSAGVDTVRELQRRNAANLAAQLAALNAQRNLVSAVPSRKRLEGWIAEAKMLEPMMKY